MPDVFTPTLAQLTTLGVGGPAREFGEFSTEQGLIAAIERADADGTPVLVVGGGSNLFVGDDGFDGLVAMDSRRHVEVQNDGSCGGMSITATAGTPWDHLVERASVEGWVGIEALSGIPGSTGAVPVQNVGAYGQEVGDVIASVRTWDRAENRIRTLARADCQFGYRDSLLKRSLRGEAPDRREWAPSPRYVVLSVTMQMRHGDLSAPIERADVADAVGLAVGERAPLADVRAAVLDLRRSKGMVLDPDDADTRSAGSFFTNPVLDPAAVAALPEDAPRFPAGPGHAPDAVKTSAAWLIQHAGLERGFALPGAPASLSTKHTLALTNRGGATGADVAALARHVQATVRERFGVELVPEPVLVGVDL